MALWPNKIAKIGEKVKELECQVQYRLSHPESVPEHINALVAE